MKKLRESKLDAFVQPKHNIVCIQCLFRNLLTSKQLNAVSDVLTPKLRRGLDFEMYYHVDGATMTRLLNTTFLLSNCKNASQIVQSEQIADILDGTEPFASFLTDSQGDTITDEVLSPQSELILRRRSAQNDNFSIFKFSFISAGYDVAWAKLLARKDTHEVIQPGSFIEVLKRGNLVSLKNDLTGETIAAKDLEELNPFLLSGYWSRVTFDKNNEQFIVDQKTSIAPFIPALVAKYQKMTKKMFCSIVRSTNDIDNTRLVNFLEKAVVTAVSSGADLRTKAVESEKIDESPYDTKLRDLRYQMNTKDTAPKSKIPQVGDRQYKDANGRLRDVKNMTWQSAEEVAKKVGAAKVFKTHCDYNCQWSGSDYVDGFSKHFDMYFYASSEDSAREMLEVFKKEHDYTGFSAMDLSHTPNYSTYTFSNPIEVPRAEAEAAVSKCKVDPYDDFSLLASKIHFLPTKQIVADMKASVNWASQVLKKMKDEDARKKREEWLKTPAGQEWKALYDQEQELLKKVDAWNAKRAKSDEAKRKAREQQKADSAEVEACFEGKSSMHPQYNMPFVPVIVNGGKKFKGKGFVVDIIEKEGSFSYGDAQWSEAKLYCPTEIELFASANLKYCKLDDSITPEECKRMQNAYFTEKVNSTLEWCRQKDPSKSEEQLKSWAASICKKYIPGIDIQKYFGIADINADKARSTAEWACGLADVSNVDDTERIITRALNKKGIDAMKYADIIRPILLKKFQRAKKFA